MRFSQRIGAVPSKPIQFESMDDSLRNRLYNSLNKTLPSSRGYYTGYDAIREYVLDKLGFNIEEANNRTFNEYFLWSEWYVPYDIIEIVLERLANDQRDAVFITSEKHRAKIGLIDGLQIILEEEKSGYRLLNNRFIPISNQEELDTLEDASNTEFEPINIHIKKAIALYSDRTEPDYENSIKESISAVESLCSIITATQGNQATLGRLLKNLEDRGIIIHKALQEAFSKLYGFTSDSSGIRHGGIDFTNAPIEDAKFMLISCSAFINYLIEKWSRLD